MKYFSYIAAKNVEKKFKKKKLTLDHVSLQVESACTSLSISPTGDFLATAHVNYLGIFLWANKTLYSHIALRSINPLSQAPYVDLPISMQTDAAANLDTQLDELKLDEGDELNGDYQSPSQLDEELITMSTLAASRWQNLLNIDIVKKRNKPIAPPKKPKQAPFFLPTVTGIDLQFDLSSVSNPNGDDNSKLLMPENFQNLTKFGEKLSEAKLSGNYQQCADHIIKIGPSMIDFEIKSLHPDGGGSVCLMLQFMKMIEYMLNTNLNFELAQTYLGVFLKAHGRTIVEYSTLKDYLKDIEVAQAKGWKVLEQKLLYGLGVVSNLRNFVSNIK